MLVINHARPRMMDNILDFVRNREDMRYDCHYFHGPNRVALCHDYLGFDFYYVGVSLLIYYHFYHDIWA